MLADRELVFTRVLSAPRSRVFKAWTDPKHVAPWWGPHGFTNPVCELDARPGGAIRIHMCGPDGTVYPMTGVYQEIVEPERLVFTSAALDNRHLRRARPQDDTDLASACRQNAAEAAAYLEGMEAGWTQSLERLEAYVCSSRSS